MKKGCLITSIVAFLLMSAALIYYFAVQNKKDPTVYEYVKPEIQDVVVKAVASGSIKPRQEVNVKPQVSGVIDKLYVEAGDIVTKGQKLALIKLIPSEVNINSATSNLELARLRLNDAKRELERQKLVNSSKLDVQQAESNYQVAADELKRQRTLFEDGVISEQQLTSFDLDAKLKKSVLDNIVISSSNTLSQAQVEVEIRQQELQAAQSNLQLLREGKTSNSKQVSNIVTSTMAGMVLDVPVEEGSSVIERNNFNEGTNIATVADMGALVFEGNIDESEVGKLKVGMPLELKVGAIDGETFNGVLEFISPKGVEVDGTVNFEIKAAIENSDSGSFLRAGYSANADIILDRKVNSITVNERDIIEKDGKSYVEKVVGDQSFEDFEITTGVSDGIIIEVTSDIDTSMQIKVRQDSDGGE